MSVILSEHLPLLATAPNGIQKLRGLILELAVRGKLVPKDPNDEPASELLKRIARERARLEAEGIFRKSKPLPPVDEDEQPFDLPRGWLWGRIADVANSQAGFAFKSSAFNDAGIGLPLIRIRDVGFSNPTTFFDGPYRDEFVVTEGDYLVSMDGQFRVAVWKGPNALLNQRVSRLQFFGSEIAQSFFAISLHIRLGELQGIKAYTTVDHLSGGQISAAVVGIPPLAEQHRIVAKVDELMALCDRLESEQADAASAHARLVETLLSTLSHSTDAAELSANWLRLAKHFDALITTETSIDALKKTGLQLAIRGKLVPQDPNDEPTSELLSRIRAESSAMGAGERVRKLKPLAPLGDDEKPFDSPKAWEWVRLQDVIHVSSGDGLTSDKMVKDGDIPVFGGNGVTGRHDQANVDKPTLVIGRVGFYCGSIHLTPEKAWVTDNALKVRFPEQHLSIEFLFWLLRATNLKGNESATAQPLVTGKGIYPIAVAIPPLAEQRRIVAAIDELMDICDRLRANIVDAGSLQVRLANTLISAALEAA